MNGVWQKAQALGWMLPHLGTEHFGRWIDLAFRRLDPWRRARLWPDLVAWNRDRTPAEVHAGFSAWARRAAGVGGVDVRLGMLAYSGELARLGGASCLTEAARLA